MAMPHFTYKRLLIGLLGTALCALLGLLLFIAWLLPRIDFYRPVLEEALTHQTGYVIKIAQLSGSWQGISPTITAHHITLSNQQQTLAIPQIACVPSLKTLFVWEPRFSMINMYLPKLHVLRDQQAQLSVNRFPLKTSRKPQLVNWLLRQDRILLTSPAIQWQDDFKRLPIIHLRSVVMTYDKTLLAQTLAVSASQAQHIGKHLLVTATWHGQDVTQWKYWSGYIKLSAKPLQTDFLVHYLNPSHQAWQAQGKIEAMAYFRQGQPTKLSAALQDASIVLQKGYATNLHTVIRTNGHIQLAYQADRSYQIKSQFSNLDINQTLGLQQAKCDATIGPQGLVRQIRLAVQHAHITSSDTLKSLFRKTLPARLNTIQINGHFRNLQLAWHNRSAYSHNFSLKTDFAQCNGTWPTQQLAIKQVSGHLDINQQQGKLILNSQHSTFAIPRILSTPLKTKALHAYVTWYQHHQDTVIRLHRIDINNPDFSGKIQGQYQHKARYIALSGMLKQIQVARIKRYLPQQLHQKFKKWFDQALLDGIAEQAQFSLNGDWRRFPFAKGQGGQFHLKAKAHHVSLRYHPNWSIIHRINGQFLWDNARLTILAKTALIDQVPLRNITVNIPDIKHQPILFASGNITSALDHYLRFVEKIPNVPHITGFVKNLRATGSASLKLTLQIPLIRSSHAKDKFTANVALQNNALYFGCLPIPNMKHMQGNLRLNEQGLHTKKLAFTALGGQATLTARSNQHQQQHIAITGTANSKEAAKRYVHFLSNYIKGQANYQAIVTIKNGLESIAIQTPLQGTSLLLPYPLYKTAKQKWPLHITAQSTPKNSWQVAYHILNSLPITGKLAIKQGMTTAHALQIGSIHDTQSHPPLSIQMAVPSITLDPWIHLLLPLFQSPTLKVAMLPIDFTLQTQQLTLFKKLFHQVSLYFARDVRQQISGRFASDKATGTVRFDPEQAALAIHLSQLDTKDIEFFGQPIHSAQQQAPFKLVNLSLHCDALYHQHNNLGHLDLSAKRQVNGWVVKLIELINPHGTLRATFASHAEDKQTTSQFMLHLQDVGQYLSGLGYVNVMGSGHGTISGNLAWSDTIKFPKNDDVTGYLTLNIQQGYFAKIDPGVSRLFSILSLQSLLQFAQFDFSRLFESGLAFDYIYGNILIQNGALSTDKLVMTGPVADVTIKGVMDFKHNTLQLSVQLEPHLIESTAIATSLIALNPWIGMAGLLGQQALKNPLGKVFIIHYDISGSIDHPIIEKQRTLQQYGRNLTGDK